MSKTLCTTRFMVLGDCGGRRVVNVSTTLWRTPDSFVEPFMKLEDLAGRWKRLIYGLCICIHKQFDILSFEKKRR